MLERTGWRAEIYERASGGLAERGAGIGAAAALLEVMRGLGIEIDIGFGISVSSRVLLAQSGTVEYELPGRGFCSSWNRIYRSLVALVQPERLHYDKALARIEPDATGVTAVFADGSRAHGDLLVGADGIHSTVRAQFAPDAVPQYAGYVAWRGIAEERDLAEATRARLFGNGTFALPDRELIVNLPIPGASDDVRPGYRRTHFAWYRPADAYGQNHAIDAEQIAALRAHAAAVLPPQIADVVRNAPRPFLQPIFDLESPRLAFGRVALLGDAAFVARPHVVAGVAKAALDAQCLAQSLAGTGIDAALERYDGERREFGARMVARGRALGALIGRSTAPEPAALLREYGAVGLGGFTARA